MGPDQGGRHANGRDEYTSNLPTVFSLLTQAEDNDEKIAEYLVYVVTQLVGLHETKEHALEIVDVLQDWKQTLNEKYESPQLH